MPLLDPTVPILHCLVCRKSFRPSPCHWRRGDVKYCSRLCRNNDICRFWDAITKDATTECWLWGNDSRRYHTMRLCGHSYRVHHLSWMIYRGLVPKDRQVLHKCDVTQCVNPDHLFLGTIQDNMIDRQKKGRTARGSRSGQTNLDEQQVARIKRALKKRGEKTFARGQLQPFLKEHKISATSLRAIREGRTWTHVK